MAYFSWLALDPTDAQTLSWAGVTLFVALLALAAVAILTERSKRAMQVIGLVAWSCCIALGFITTALYFWHHYYRS